MVLENYSSIPTDSQKKSLKKKWDSSQFIVVLLYTLILIFLFYSFFYSQYIINQIENKKESIIKLKKIEQKILMENEKIKILLTEIQNKKQKIDQKLIKIIEAGYFEKEAEKIVIRYQEANALPRFMPLGHFLIIGIILIATLRLLYLEFFSPDLQYKRNNYQVFHKKFKK